jgi:integrase
MTTPRDPSPSRRVRANGDGTVYQRKDGRWEAAGYVLALGNTRKRVRVYGTTRKDALARLTEKIAASNRGVPVPSAQGSVSAYLTYWLENVAIHQLRENTHTRYTACINQYLVPAWARRSSPSSPPRTSAPGSTSSAPPASAAPAASTLTAISLAAAPPERAAPSGSPR